MSTSKVSGETNMVDDMIRKYDKALEALKQSELKIAEMQATVRKAAGAKWENLTVFGVKGNKSTQASGPQYQNLDGSKWPTAQQIADAISEQKECRRLAVEAHDNIPSNVREKLGPPN